MNNPNPYPELTGVPTTSDLQTVSAAGINPFAVKLLCESAKKSPIFAELSPLPPIVAVEYDGVLVTIRKVV